MTARDHFRAIMAERRQWPKGSADWDYRTSAARKLLWIIWGVPTTEWEARERKFARLNGRTKMTRNEHGFPDLRSQDEIDDDLEFSNWGRSPRFPPGWYIAPLVALAVICGLTALAVMVGG